jgi:hypothetical protein
MISRSSSAAASSSNSGAGAAAAIIGLLLPDGSPAFLRRLLTRRMTPAGSLTVTSSRTSSSASGQQQHTAAQFAAAWPAPSAKSQKLNLFFLPKHSGFFLTAARCSERSQAGRDSNGCGCRRVPTADEWSPPSRVGGRGRARPRGRSVVDILHCKGFAVSSVMWYDPT